MDLILWRHAEAVDEVDGGDDLQRNLTSRGEKQAMRVAAWLDRNLPEGARILSSPAVRCEQTAMALGRKFKTRAELAPDVSAASVLEVAKWPDAKEHVVIVGHQPTLGEVAAQLMQLKQPTCQIRKGAVWWFRTRERDGHQQTLLIAVQSPDTVA